MQENACLLVLMEPEQLDAIFKALADPTRRRIVDRLAARPNQSLFELCAGAVAEGQAAMSRQAVSQHLDVLEKAGLISVSWSGRTKLHSLELGPLRAAQAAWLGRYLEEGPRHENLCDERVCR